MRLIKFISIILSVFVLQSCKCKKETSNMQNDSQQEKNTTILSGTYSISFIETNKNLPQNLTITFDDSANKISGFSGCNRFFGTYKTQFNSIKIGDLASTEMYCQNVMDIENSLLKTLAQINSFSIIENEIQLKNNSTILIKASKEIQSKQNYILEYSATSRGTYKQIIINNKTISTLHKRGGKSNLKTYNKDHWKKLIETLKPINIEALSKLEAPSKKFQFDGAAIARLKVLYNDSVYETPPFDHGNPPKAIETLVNEILSISENIE